jgi:hypothetical protein
MKRTVAAALLSSCLLLSLVVSAQTGAVDERFRGIVQAANIGSYVKTLSARPHHLGSAYDKQNAEWILARFREWGWDARIESYDVLFPTPSERLLEMVAPTRFTAALEEPAIPVDPTSGRDDKTDECPFVNGISAMRPPAADTAARARSTNCWHFRPPQRHNAPSDT